LNNEVVLIDERIVLQLPDVGDGDFLVNKFLGAGRVIERWMPPGGHIAE
jgi:hypothetical protein